MTRRPPRSTRTATLFPHTTLCRSTPARLLAQIELKKAGLTFDDLMLKDIASADAIGVFADESVAGVAVYEPTLSQALKAANTEGARIIVRSDEHTSELQSLMRTSYAVFCLKKKNNRRRQTDQ